MNWNDVPVLVTGAGGFIGSHLVEELARQGAHVRAFVRYNSRGDWGHLSLLSPELRGQLEVVAGDLRDSSAVLAAVQGCAYVFHLGALITIPYSYRHPREVVETNVLGTLNILEAARRAGPLRVVHTSTSEVYGTAQTVPISESHPLRGQSPYSASKIGADKLVESYTCAFGLQAVTVRPFNTFGPRQSARAIIPAIITQALVQDRVRLGSLTPTRDFTFVADTVRGFLCAAGADEALGRVVNLGNDAEISIGNLAQRIVALVGRPVTIEQDDQRLRPATSEVNRLHADTTLARQLLGWQPAVSLEAGLARTIEWIKSHLALYRVGDYQV